ncbi:MAG: hypothetical protein K0R90_1282 [Oscillospiraceae bacterium]|jgi:cellulose biosynthesis protein BcsQ|nr:hypothetical protein [Oscillospiraceae bacterium]
MAKIIAVTGNSGKTVFSFFLAEALAQKDEKAILLSTDSIISSSNVLFPTIKTVQNKSVGKILSLPVIDRTDITENIFLTPNNKNLGLLSYAPNENINSFPLPTEQNISKLFHVMTELVDYIVVDTQSGFNDIDMYALSHADKEICITTADYKGLCFRKFYNHENALDVLFTNNAYNPVSDISRTFKSPVKYTLTFQKEFLPLFNGINITDVTIPKRYQKEIQKIIHEVILSE